jgi:FkbM family methyltransferase
MFRALLQRLRRISLRRPFRLRRLPAPSQQAAEDAPKVLVDVGDFQIFIAPDDHLIGRRIAANRGWEPEVSLALRRLLRPGQVLVDIGANIGFHSLLGAHLVGPKGKVIAFEMDGANCALLRASMAANGFEHITLHEVAVAESAQTLSFALAAGTGNGGVVTEVIAGDLGTARWTEAKQARAVAVDDVIPPGEPVHVIKMDIEGSEFRALCGMTRLLKEQRPILLFEFFPRLLRDVGRVNPETLLDTVRVFHYDVWRAEEVGKRDPQPITNAEAIALAGDQYVDLVARPR